MKKVENALPTSPNKRGKIVTTLAKKYQMRIVLKDKPGQRQQELADEEKEWLRKHLDSANTFLHKFGMERQIYIGKIDREKNIMSRKSIGTYIHLIYTLYPLA